MSGRSANDFCEAVTCSPAVAGLVVVGRRRVVLPKRMNAKPVAMIVPGESCRAVSWGYDAGRIMKNDRKAGA